MELDGHIPHSGGTAQDSHLTSLGHLEHPDAATTDLCRSRLYRTRRPVRRESSVMKPSQGASSRSCR